jgi:SAM-dependent methyltransferase
MTVRVLQERRQIHEARAEMDRRNLSTLSQDVPVKGLVGRLLGRRCTVERGNPLKSWDVLATVEFIEANYPRTARVLDVGAWNSEVLWALHRAGFPDLTGIDVNPEVREMPFADAIRYEVGDYLKSSPSAPPFDVVTAISVIEHGFDAHALLDALRRLLAPGGSFVASFDYWPEKIDTSGSPLFGMPWTIFSRAEVEAFLAKAQAAGFEQADGVSLEARERPVRFADRDYTFGWLAFRRAR